MVTEVPASEVLQDRTGSDANPALLCYVRKDQDLVDTLHREVFEREQVEKQMAAIDPAEPLETKEPSASNTDTLVDVDMAQGSDVPELQGASQSVDIDMSESQVSAHPAKSDAPLIDLDSQSTTPGEKDEAKKEVDDLMA